MQLIHQTTLSVNDYIYEQAWQEARLPAAPNQKRPVAGCIAMEEPIRAKIRDPFGLRAITVGLAS